MTIILSKTKIQTNVTYIHQLLVYVIENNLLDQMEGGSDFRVVT